MNVASGASSVINRYRVPNLDLPFFFAVSVIEWNTAYSSAPSCVLKPPETLVLTFNILIAASLAWYPPRCYQHRGSSLVVWYALMFKEGEEEFPALDDSVLQLLKVLSIVADILIEQFVKPFLIFLSGLLARRSLCIVAFMYGVTEELLHVT